MLSVAKLRVGQEAYQLSGVAQSLDDYYSGAGEAAGQWIGVGAELLGLDGEVDPDDLRAVLAGIAPGTGGLTPNGETPRPHPRRVPGFDLTFKAPKSVSVLYGVSDDPRVQAAIIEAGQTAVSDALAWLEREAINVRRGTGNEAFLNDLAARDPEAAAAARIRSVPAHGVVAASFRHRTSRAGDPLLHWHTLVANLAPGSDGRWTAFVHPDLYRAVRAAGEVFQASLRAELTASLGVDWRPGRHVPEIAGVPDALCELFSKRSQQITDWLDATGTPDTPAGRQAAVLATRRGKPEVEHERFDTAWKTEAIAAGWGPAEAEALLAALDTTDGQRHPADRPVPPADDAWIHEIGRALTESDSTFTRPQLAQAVAARTLAGAAAGTVDRLVAAVLADPSIVPVDGGTEPRWTTTDLLATEGRFLDTVARSRGLRAPVAADIVNSYINEASTLGDDQAAAVRALARSTDAVSVLVGPAGTGKTFTLDTLRSIHQHAGHRVVGAAPSARAAHELATDAHIPASTLHRLLGTWARGHDRPDTATVLVIDEAAMAGIRELETAISTVVAAEGRVVLVGDHHQLPEVTAGGGFAALATDPEATVATLTVNRRQHQAWEIAALAQLRDGHVPAAVDAYRSHGRVVVADDHTAMLAEAVDRWQAARADGRDPVLIAGTNATVRALNDAVRTRLRSHGHLSEPAGTWTGRDFAVGDRVVLRINDYTAATTAGAQAHVLNGQTATLTARTDTGVVVRLDHDHAEIHLGADYLGAGGLDHAYALTAHRAQGGTWDLAIAVGSDGLYREAGYLVLSRGRHENWLILTRPEVDELDAELHRHDSPLHLPDEHRDPDEELDRRLAISRAKHLALVVDPDAARVARLGASLDLADLEKRAATARRVEGHATSVVDGDPDEVATRIDRITHTAHHATIGATAKALDRNNMGTITGVDDTAGTVHILFVATDGRQAERELPWRDVQVIDPNATVRALPAVASDTVERLITPLRQQHERWTRILAAEGLTPGDRARYERAVQLSIDRATNKLAAAQPEWLTNLLGSRPSRPAAAQVWDDTVTAVAAHRLRYHLGDHTPGLGARPAEQLAASDWDTTQGAVARARIWLDTHDPDPIVPMSRSRTSVELDDRRQELEAILASAPADQRGLITQLRAEGTLPYDNANELLADALATQGDRQRWILEHWPHVVEYAQLRRAIDDSLQLDVDGCLERLDTARRPALARAINSAEPWLHRVAAALATPDGLDPIAVGILGDIAEHRERWSIVGPAPLGTEAWEPEQAVERALLRSAIEERSSVAAVVPPAHSYMDLALEV